MTKIEMIQSRIMERMQDILSNEQLQHLENVLAIEFHGIEVQEECTQLVTSEIHWQKILRTFIASKRIENCSPGTLERYNDCVVKLVTALNKRLQDITTNDIRYYLAMYQEQRKISMSYMDTIRRYLSSFFAWISDEGYISRNPMRRLKKIKVPRAYVLYEYSSVCTFLLPAESNIFTAIIFFIDDPLIKLFVAISPVLLVVIFPM